MEIIFTNTNGQRILWDGLLWSSVDLPLVALQLNCEIPPAGREHSGVLESASQRLVQEIGPVTFEILDDTGWPDEALGNDTERPADSGLDEIKNSEHGSAYERATQSRIKESTLAEARAVLSGSVCPDGSVPADEDWERRDREWAALIKWAEATGRVLSGPGPERKGGREHALTFSAESERWIKFTLPDLAGFTVDWKEDGQPYMRNAYPSEYLERLQRQNDLLVDQIELLGLWQVAQHSWSIVIAQPDVPGDFPEVEAIHTGLAQMGFVRLRWEGIGYEHSEAWRIGQWLVWDIHSSNVIQTEDGLIVPIDVIITPLPCGYPPKHFHELEAPA